MEVLFFQTVLMQRPETSDYLYLPAALPIDVTHYMHKLFVGQLAKAGYLLCVSV